MDRLEDLFSFPNVPNIKEESLDSIVMIKLIDFEETPENDLVECKIEKDLELEPFRFATDEIITNNESSSHKEWVSLR